MKECDNSTRKIHISSNFILSISLITMFDTLLLRASLHCNTPLHFTTLHPTTLHYTSLHFTLHPPTLHYTSLHFTLHHTSHFTTLHPTTLHYTLLHFTLHPPTLRYISHFTTLHTSPHFTHLHFTTLRYTSHFTTLHPNTLHYTYRHFTSSHWTVKTRTIGIQFLCMLYITNISISTTYTTMTTEWHKNLFTITMAQKGQHKNRKPKLHWVVNSIRVSEVYDGDTMNTRKILEKKRPKHTLRSG